ncbi:hypothetical protein [Rhizobium sp. MHM7A]|uniref:hypothetical protein n=1 Tax=Rhizobium sp. MHM7A TaxID=2583233 RepID=UPI0011075D03|nr:hypothetical protein [Rhizobium sp. MHM7A]TLX16686.1 hypothetical protein FFR93_04915 [Rhizobium sp. MHM7A]
MKKLGTIAFWLVIGLVGVPVFGILISLVLSSFTDIGGPNNRPIDTSEIKQSEPASTQPPAELVAALSWTSDYTSVEKDRIKDGMRGKVVQWTMPVWNVSKDGDENYVVQTDSSAGVGAFCRVASDDPEQSFVKDLKAGQFVTCKGIVDGYTLGNVNISPAVLLVRP